MQIDGWVEYKGSDITTKITKGSSPKWQGFDYQNDGTLFVTSENVRNGFLDISSPKYLPLEFNKKLKNSQLEVGDILINIVGASIGRSCQFNIDNQLANINQAVCLFRTNELADRNYIQQYLQLPSTINRLLGTQTESARPNLSLSDLREFTFILPPKNEQKKIAEILSTWDKAIETVEKLVANSQQQKKALMQQLLTGQKRLLDDNGVRFSGSWEEPTLGEIANVYQPKTISQEMLSESGYPVYGANGVIGFYSDFNHETEQIAVTCRGSTCGVINWTEPKSWITGNAMVINVDDNPIINKKYLYYVLSGSNLKYLISGSGQPQITGNIKKHRILAPSTIEQEKIAQVLTLADREIDLYKEQLDKLKLEKKALMQQLLTGQKRVKLET